MENPFELIEQRLNHIENLLLLLHKELKQPAVALEKKYMNSQEAADFLSLSIGTVRNHSATIPHYKRNGKLYFVKEELVKYLEEGVNGERSILRYKRRKR